MAIKIIESLGALNFITHTKSVQVGQCERILVCGCCRPEEVGGSIIDSNISPISNICLIYMGRTIGRPHGLEDPLALETQNMGTSRIWLVKVFLSSIVSSFY